MLIQSFYTKEKLFTLCVGVDHKGAELCLSMMCISIEQENHRPIGKTEFSYANKPNLAFHIYPFPMPREEYHH